MDDRTPTTEEVRAAWAWSIVGTEPHAEAEFDRWFTERIAEAKREGAWIALTSLAHASHGWDGGRLQLEADKYRESATSTGDRLSGAHS